MKMLSYFSPSVNGLAMSVASLFKAVGPSLEGGLFSWSLTSGMFMYTF